MERESVCCRFDDHERRLFPKNTQYPEVDRLVVWHPAQSASKYATKEVMSIWEALGGYTRDLDSFGKKRDKIAALQRSGFKNMLTESGDGVAIS
ncbi:hypothetical protein Tco_1066701 [Tanacetum coccineum]|uniref:Uncharacterized protein n=1 Tax=Tanacetum coccineum TaxID=301880 RepID=A0ABQ5HAT5_9ASTR